MAVFSGLFEIVRKERETQAAASCEPSFSGLARWKRSDADGAFH